MVYRFLLLSDEVDKFHRELCIDSESTFDNLRECILDSVEYTKDQMSSFFICDDNWEKGTEVTLVEMDSSSEYDNWIMSETKLYELVEDEGQKLLFIFDYMTDRAFFLELKEIVIGKEIHKPTCTASVGIAPQQVIDFENFAATSSALDIDEKFYGDEAYNEEDLDQEGFDYNDQPGGIPYSDELI